MLRLLGLLSRRRARARAALSIAGIALGVALGYGVHLVNRAAVEELAASVRTVAGEADLQVRGGRSGFPEALFPQVARIAGVAWVNPALELDAGIAGSDERTLRVIGVDALREGGPQPLAPDKVLLSPRAAAALGEGPLRLVVGQHVVELEVAGVGELKGFAALTDISTAQWRLGRLGGLNRLHRAPPPGGGGGGASSRDAPPPPPSRRRGGAAGAGASRPGATSPPRGAGAVNGP